MMQAHLQTFVNYGLLVLVMWALDRARLDRAQPLYRPVVGRTLSGVCAGIARYLEIPTWFVRIGFLAALWLGAHAILAYLALEVIVRWAPEERELLWSTRAWHRLRGALAR